MKPNLTFLRKVEAKRVYKGHSYSVKRGGYWYFVGGEKTAERHAKGGFINMPSFCRLFEHSYATLTDTGRAALQTEEKEKPNVRN